MTEAPKSPIEAGEAAIELLYDRLDDADADPIELSRDEAISLIFKIQDLINTARRQ